jgi:hypothetical protein
MWVNRYEITPSFDPMLFNRHDRWTGGVELCATYFDEKMYCGAELRARANQAIKARQDAANLTFRKLGYSQDQIEHWPKDVLEDARRMVGNGVDDDEVAEFLKGQNVSPPEASK